MNHAVTVFAHAKLNLLLRVLAREDDGYHGIETVFCRLGLADELTVERRPGEGVSLEVRGAAVGPEAENLAVLGAAAALALLRTRFAVHLTLTKRIPVGAGLGGGSADAAAALHAVNALTGQALPRHELFQCAARLGADVPFCFSGAPLALAWGRGERLLTLPPLPVAPVLLLTPPVPVRTGDAYGWVDEAQQAGSRRGALALDLEALGSWGSVARLAGNDFESPVFSRLPAVRSAFEALVATRPLMCRMTGSGSTVFAVYRTAGDREDAVRQLGRKHGQVTEAETVVGSER
jgi:4-diphosphocytidyl-2-C-methyl-D-erythritol kinase